MSGFHKSGHIYMAQGHANKSLAKDPSYVRTYICCKQKEILENQLSLKFGTYIFLNYFLESLQLG